jgi:hypothetical protein
MGSQAAVKPKERREVKNGCTPQRSPAFLLVRIVEQSERWGVMAGEMGIG